MLGPRGLRFIVLLAVAGAAACAALEDHVLIRNLRVVESGTVYRGAEQKPWPFARVIERYNVRTVLALVEPVSREREIAASRGVRWLCVPLTSAGTPALFDDLETAAAVVADPANRPVFFHCKRGVYRSNLTQAVYRMKFCGWTLEQSLDELRTLGFDPAASGGDNCCGELIERYYKERIAAAH